MARLFLGAAALLVFGSCVYLFLQVRAKPAAAEARSAPPGKPDADADPGEKPADSGKPARRDGAPMIGVKHADKPTDPVEPEAGPTAAVETDDLKSQVKLDAVMLEANKAYDRQDFDEARSIAQKVLKKQPTNSRMLRILVSAACVESDGPEAQKYYVQLPDSDRAAMRTRCAKYQVSFTEPPAPVNTLPHR